MPKPVKSRRGVYYDLNESPYEVKSPYGDLFKFSSAKKMEIYTRDVEKEVKRVENLMERHDLKDFIPDEIKQLIFRAVYQSFYRQVQEG